MKRFLTVPHKKQSKQKLRFWPWPRHPPRPVFSADLKNETHSFEKWVQQQEKSSWIQHSTASPRFGKPSHLVATWLDLRGDTKDSNRIFKISVKTFKILLKIHKISRNFKIKPHQSNQLPLVNFKIQEWIQEVFPSLNSLSFKKIPRFPQSQDPRLSLEMQVNASEKKVSSTETVTPAPGVQKVFRFSSWEPPCDSQPGFKTLQSSVD